MKKIEDYVRSIPDFPEPGIIFRDVTSILQDADGLKLAIDSMQECLKDTEVDVIVGTESRGKIQWLHSGITTTLCHNIIQFSVWLRMKFIKDNTVCVKSMLIGHIGRKHLIRTIGWLKNNLFL